MGSDQIGTLHATSPLPPENDSVFGSGVHQPHDEHKADRQNTTAKPRAPLPVRRLLTLVQRDGRLLARINHGVSGAVACPPRSVEEAQVGTSEDQQIERGVAGLNCACNPQMTPTEGD